MTDLITTCSELQSDIARADEFLRDFHALYPSGREQIQPVQQQVRRLDTVTGNFVAAASNFADVPTSLPVRLHTGVRDMPAHCIHVLKHLQTFVSPPNRSEQYVCRNIAAGLDAYVKALERARKVLSLAVETLSMATNVYESLETGASPPYAASGIIQEILAVRVLLVEVTDTKLGQNAIIGEFLESLQQFAEGQAGSLLPPGSAAPHPRLPSDSGSAYAGSVHSGINLAIGPEIINPRHISRMTNIFREPYDVLFCHQAQTPTLAISNLFNSVSLYNAFVPASPEAARRVNNCLGCFLVLSPAETLLAIVTEYQGEIANSINQHHLPIYHDGVNFEKRTMCVWDYGGKQPRIKFVVRSQAILPFAFSPDGKLLAVRALRNRVELLETTHGQGRGMVRCHTDEVTAARFTADGEQLITMSRDGTIRVTDVATQSSISKLDVENWRSPLLLMVTPAPPAGVRPSGPPSDIVASVWGSTVHLWNRYTGAVATYNLGAVRTTEGWPLCISPDLRYLACRTDDGLDVSDLSTGRILCRFRVATGFVTAASFSWNGQYLAVGSVIGREGFNKRTPTGWVDVWELVG